MSYFFMDWAFRELNNAFYNFEVIIEELRCETTDTGVSYYYDDTTPYVTWLAMTKRLLAITYPNDKYAQEFEDISKEPITPLQQKRMLAILHAFVIYPNSVENNQMGNEKKTDTINITNNITSNQFQSQHQELDAHFFVEAIKDELTGSQIKELKEILTAAGQDGEKAKTGVVSKIKEFGINVASNILANIITNSSIWMGLTSR